MFICKVNEFNSKHMDRPLGFSQVEKTIKQHEKTDYQYKCKDQPMCAVCNAPLCKARKFGIGDNYDVIISDLTKLESDESMWFLNVDGKRMSLNTEQLFDQQTIMNLKANDENKRLSYFEMDAAMGTSTGNFWLFGGTGDFNRISEIDDVRSLMDNIVYGIRDYDFPYFIPKDPYNLPLSGATDFISKSMEALEAVNGVPTIEEETEVKITPTKGLLTRTMDSRQSTGSSPDDIKMRVARYVQDIRNKRKGLKDA